MFAQQLRNMLFDDKHAKNRWRNQWQPDWPGRFSPWARFTFCLQQRPALFSPVTTFPTSLHGAGEFRVRVIIMLIVRWSGSKNREKVIFNHSLRCWFHRAEQLTEIRTAWNQAVQKLRWSMECLVEKRDILNRRKKRYFYDVGRLIDHCPLIFSNECLWRIIFHFCYLPFIPTVYANS